MSVPSQKQSCSPTEDGQQGATAGSFYYYSPHSAAPGSERSWQESYNQMARRVTGGPSSWGQQHQEIPAPQSHNSYGQQQYQYSMFQAPNQNNTSTAPDPWNWGWDESSNNESGNNNIQQDPTWDWSVDGANSYQQQQQQQQPAAPQPPPPGAPSPAVNYPPNVHQPQVWPSPSPVYGNDTQQIQYNNVSQTALEDSFMSSAVTNQNSFNQQPVVFQKVNKSGQNFCSFGTSDSQGLHLTNNNSVADHKPQQTFVSNENLNKNNQLQNYNSGFYSGFPIGSNDVGFQQSQSGEYRLQGTEIHRQEDNKPETVSTDVVPEIPCNDRNSNLPDATGNPPHSTPFQEAINSMELLNSCNIKQEAKNSTTPSDLRTKTIELTEDTSSISEDLKIGASASHETLPSQWSTESVPSLGSEEVSHSIDGVSANNIKKEIVQESSYPQSYQYSCNKDQLSNGSTKVHDLSGNVWEHESSQSYTADFPNSNVSEGAALKQEIRSLASPDNHNSCIQSSSESSLIPNAVLTGKHSEIKSFISEPHCAPVGASPQPSVDNVANNLKSLSLGSTASNNTTDVENVEIAPPENNPPPGHQTRSDSILPPPPAASLSMNAGSNPYAARHASLNHKYSNKHRILPQTPSSDSAERMNYTMSLAATEPEHGKKPSPHFMTPNEMGTPVYTGNFSARNKASVLSTTEEAVNLETVPDNKERPDFIDTQHASQLDRKSVSPLGGTRPNAVLGQDSVRGPTIPWSQQQQPIYSMSPENQEVAPRCGPERNQYLETGHLPDDDLDLCGHTPESVDNLQHRSQPFLPPPGLHRMVPGQQTEQEINPRAPLGEPNQVENGVNDDVCTPPPGLHRMIPGQFTEGETSGISENSMLNPSHPSAGTDDLILHRMVPGQLTEDAISGSLAQDDAIETTIPTGSSVDEIPPPGLRRMVPGESSSPESQGNSTSLLVTGSTVPTGTFQPIDSVPMEPRVVTGVAQDEMDITGIQGTSVQLTPSPVQMSSSGRATSETESPTPEQNLTTSTLPQPPTERSETIGSDSVETYPPPPSDNSRELSTRRDNSSKERDRRHRDDQDSEERNRRRQTNGREYYGSREREESPNSGRYRGEDRERRTYERERNRDREDSPSASRYRYDSRQEYGRRGHEDEHRPHHRRGYDRSDEDADTEGYYSDRDRDRKVDHKRDHNHDRDRRENVGYWDDYRQHYRGHSERDRNQHDEHDKGSRDRPDHRSSGRLHDRDERDRERYRRRYDYPDYHDNRRVEDYYGRGYEDDIYYRNTQRSRPNSRSGSRPEYEDDRRRDYRSYGAMDYYNRGLQSIMYYQYHQYMAQWQQELSQQRLYHAEDRGSVHSGRSSANEELHRERYQRTGPYHPYDYYRPSSLSGDFEAGRVPDQSSSAVDGISSLPQTMTPAMFTTAHVKGVFSTHGRLLKTPAHYPLDGQPAVVEFHNLQDIFRDDEVYKELKDFPGPLIRNVTHKNSVIGFCMRKIQKAEKDPSLHDRDSVILFWRLLILLLKQNGTVVGSDIAELLLHSSSSEPSRVQQPTPSPAVSQSSINDIQSEDRAPNKTEEEVTNSYREFLLYGNTKEALEWAMNHGLWGHALFLASKMDQRTYANVMMRFANGLTMNDPLQTLYQLMSGRQPAAVTCCADEKWGDWKPHLAMIVSNSSQWVNLHRDAITTLGDTLAARGCLHAAHFCYVMAQLEFGTYSAKSSKVVLLGSSHAKSFSKFATNEAIQITEVYLYTIQLANPEFEAPHFQPYKLLYAQRLAEYGMVLEALQYVEIIAKAVMKQPTCYDLSFLQQVYELGDQLRYHDPVFSGEEADASWLNSLGAIIEAYLNGTIQQEGPSYGSTSNLSYSEGESLQPQYQNMDFMQTNQEPQYYDNSWHQQHQSHQEMQQWQQHQQPPPAPPPQQQQELQSGIEVKPEGYHQELEPVAEQVHSSYLSHPEQSTDALNQDTHLLQQPQQQPEDEDFHSRGGGDGGGEGIPAMDGLTNNSAFDYWSMSANKQQEGGPQISLTGSVPLDEPGGPQPNLQHPPSSPEDKTPTKSKSKKEQPKTTASSSWFGGIWNKLALRPKNQMILPDDKNPSIVWDPEKKRWTNLDSDEDETTAAPPPPPKTSQLPGTMIGPSAPASAGHAGPNIYKMNRGRGSRANYVDVLGSKTVSNPVVPAPTLFQPPTTTPMNLFVPEPVETKETNSVDFLTCAPATSETPEQVSGESSQTGGAVQPAVSGPLMFNPSSFSQPAIASKGTGTLGRKRYPN